MLGWKPQPTCSKCANRKFLGHFNDEVDFKSCNNYIELKDKIDKYVYYYNTSRYQWNKNMLAPIEVREYLISYNDSPF